MFSFVDSALNATREDSSRVMKRRHELAAELGIPDWFVKEYTSVITLFEDRKVYLDVLFGKEMGKRRFADPEVGMRLLADRLRHLSAPRGSFDRVFCEAEEWRAAILANSVPVKM